MEPPPTTRPLLRPLLSPWTFSEQLGKILYWLFDLGKLIHHEWALRVKKRNDHGLLLQSIHPRLLGSWGSPMLRLSFLTCALRVVCEHPTLATSHHVIQEFEIRLYHLQDISATFHTNCLWSLQRIFGANLAQTLCSFRSLVRIVSTVPTLIPTASDIMLTDDRQSFSSNFSTSRMFSALRAFLGAPDLGSVADLGGGMGGMHPPPPA